MHPEGDLPSVTQRLHERGEVARQQYEQRSMRVDEQRLRSASRTSIESGIGSITSITASVSPSDFSMSSPLTVRARQTYISQTDSDSDTLDEDYDKLFRGRNPTAGDFPRYTLIYTLRAVVP